MTEKTLTHSKKCYYFEGFPVGGLVHAFSSRISNNMALHCGDKKQALDSRFAFLISQGINLLDLVCAKQAHGGKVALADESCRGRGALSYDTSIEGADALVTNTRNLPLAVFSADCLPVFLYAASVPAIGLIHASWRSTKEKITVSTVESLRKNFGVQAQDLLVGFGPAIRSCCYRVGEEFLEYFPGSTAQKDGFCYFDLACANKKQLLSLGVKESNIFDCALCTSCKEDAFFSFRKEGKDCGRMMSVMMLK